MTKIHAIVDALSNPTGFFLTPGQTHDLHGANALFPGISVETLIGDQASENSECSWSD